MGLKMNPLVPTQEHLEYFYQTVLLPRYRDDLEEYDIGDGETYSIPKLSFNKTTIEVESEFERGDKVYRPQDMFFGQNKGKVFRPFGKRYQQQSVDKRIAKATKMPKLQFSLEPVKLIKPRYGKLPQSVFS